MSIEVGMIVRYAPEWCSQEERKYLHVVKENRISPITGEMTRWLIEAINTGMFFHPTEDVEGYMIEPTGFNINDLIEEEK